MQHERFVCIKSKITNASVMDYCCKEVESRTNRRTRARVTEDVSISTVTDKPVGWELHTPVFYLLRGDGDELWSTHIRTHTHAHQIVYPTFVSKHDTDVFTDGEEEYIKLVSVYALNKGFKRIDCSCGASIPSSRCQERDIFHCHPSFHSYPYLKRPWYDWVMVKWRNTADDDSKDDEEVDYINIAAHLFLFAKLSDNVDASKLPVIVAVIQSLHLYDPNFDSLLYFAKGDSLDPSGLTVIEATAIQETAFVLPCVKRQGDEFPFAHDAASYFLIFPPRHKWIDIWRIFYDYIYLLYSMQEDATCRRMLHL